MGNNINSMANQIDRIGIFVLILYNSDNILLHDYLCLPFTIQIN